ncbi:MAG: azurin [Pseudobacteriovorax sp.]|nr:azurin [Pseudobacteriovorax sp.]
MKILTRLLAASALFFFAANAYAKTCKFTVKGSDAMQYDIKEIKIEKECKTVEITLQHSGKLPKVAMGHNLVISKTSDIEGVNKDGIAAGPTADYVKKGDKRVIAATKVVGGGEKDTISFSVDKLKAGEDYSYFCTFPGHYTIMRGKLILVPVKSS